MFSLKPDLRPLGAKDRLNTLTLFFGVLSHPIPPFAAFGFGSKAAEGGTERTPFAPTGAVKSVIFFSFFSSFFIGKAAFRSLRSAVFQLGQ